DDILIFDGTVSNKYGHIAIISKVTDKEIEIVQQNPGQFDNSRETLSIENRNNKWKIKSNRILGWLRKRE
ncbi:MAG: CHAP domain-containing protein, partial [Prevotellaceae bacterium]|nr:CHAP domain-containing protein [Prevotellaceae bacterium]